MKYLILYLLAFSCNLSFTNACENDSIDLKLIGIVLISDSSTKQKELELRLVPIVKKNKVSFKYYLKNNNNSEVLINTASFGNGSFFNLLVYDEKNNFVDMGIAKINLRYSKIFEDSRFYSIIKSNQEISRKYKTYGFNCISKIKIIQLNLKPGKYKAILRYSIEKRNLKIKNPHYEKLWYGDLVSDTVSFEVKSL